jgi:hypothetical protein
MGHIPLYLELNHELKLSGNSLKSQKSSNLHLLFSPTPSLWEGWGGLGMSPVPRNTRGLDGRASFR